ncbi:RNase adapter RapZ [Parvibium lacunae]|uniref:RNase adapter RapZ n=1 Tax=Parvibium lacunae TaxID=1888893 RepID=A0A368L524_9BURK|nr:RNase adapter RapZ [Parvibium lacunae]RCS58658.1 RNase adapter RapZ [Parvibium lacunae]
MKIVIVSGQSGSGKSVVMRVLEDAGYCCVDNLPASFVPQLITKWTAAGETHLAISCDTRSATALQALPTTLDQLRAQGHDVKALFLTTNNATLIQRYSESRRRHPLATQPQSAQMTLLECIQQERDILAPIAAISHVVDTSGLAVQTLRAWVIDFVSADRAPLTLLFESFAFKQAIPLDADLVFDVRCLPNPYYDLALRPLSGLDAPVAQYLGGIETVRDMIGDITRFVSKWLPHYLHDNRSYLTVAVGCTGGQHRSVYCVQEIAKHFAAREQVLVRHRALAK